MHITRAVKIYYRTSDGHLYLNCHSGNLLEYIPIRLWLTFEGKIDSSSGLIVNVSHIKKMVKEHLEKNEVYCRSIYEILSWSGTSFINYFENCTLRKVSLEYDDHKFTVKTDDLDMLKITRKYELAAAHRLWNDQWESDKNYQEFGKCANPNGHGHNYTLEISVQCRVVNPDDTVDVVRVDSIVNDCVIEKLDHKNLCLDIPEMKGMVPTVENMSVVVWNMLSSEFEQHELVNVRIWETQNTYADYSGD